MNQNNPPPKIDPEIRVALITGASVRIGKAITKALHASGYNVIIHYNQSKNSALKLSIELNDIRKNSAFIQAGNLNSLDEISHLASASIQLAGRLDLLVNNASVFYPTPLSSSSEELQLAWDDIISCNQRAPYFLSLQCLSSLKRNKGSIINIIDVYSNNPKPEYSIYNISKTALTMITKTLAQDCAPDIRVNGISPGAILPANIKDTTITKENTQDLSNIPLKRMGTPENIASAVLFLVDNDYITGQIIEIDGGKSLTE